MAKATAKRTIGLAGTKGIIGGVCALLVAVVLTPHAGHAAGRPQAAERPTGAVGTIWDGVFTEEQATRGRAAYTQSCGSCHKDDLLGDNTTPALMGTDFSARWVGQTVDDMVQTVKQSMPQDAPGSLTQRAYVDIISYLLKTNGSPAGAIDLPLERTELAGVRITKPER